MNKKFFIVLAMSLILAGCSSPSSSNLSEGVSTEAVSAPNTPEAFQQKAMMLLAQGQVPAAIETLQESIDLFPQDQNSYFALAQVFMKMGSFDNAIAVCQKAIQSNPDNGHIYLLMAGCYDLKNEPQKASDLVKLSMAVFQKQNDTKNAEAAAAVLQKLTTQVTDQAQALQKNIK